MALKNLALWCVFLSLAVLYVYAEDKNTKSEKIIQDEAGKDNNAAIELPVDTFKQLMWKKCSKSSYATCAKLVLVNIVEKLHSSESYILLPGISLQKRNAEGDPAAAAAAGQSNLQDTVVGTDFNAALDKYLLQKIRSYLGSLTLSVKLLDKNTIDDMRAFGNVISDSSQVEGRGKKKYMQSLMMAGWMSAATLLALTMKTIAILSGKAILAALLSLMLSVISAFSHKGHGDLKSTTYEIITKPVVAHSHSADLHEAHPSELNSVYTGYKRSITPAEVIIKDGDIPEDVEHIIRKIKDRTPYYTPVSIEYSKS